MHHKYNTNAVQNPKTGFYALFNVFSRFSNVVVTVCEAKNNRPKNRALQVSNFEEFHRGYLVWIIRRACQLNLADFKAA